MRVLQVDSGREWRGGQNQVRLLCRELTNAPGVEVRLLTRRDGELARRVMADGVPVHEVPWRVGIDPRVATALPRLLRVFRPDLIHVHDSHALTTALLARWLASPGRGHDHPPHLVGSRRVDFHVGRWSGWRKVRHIVAVSDAVKAVLIADGLNPADITVVPSGVDADEVRRAAEYPLHIRARLGLPAGTPLAVNVAALVDHKDQRTLLRAAAAARAHRPDLHWAIAGEGELRGSLEAEIARLDLRDRVHLLGYMDQADALIREGDVFVLSSKEEGLGSVLLNALALEKPVVATAGGGIPEVLPPQALVPVGDAEALGRKVAEVLTNPPSPLPLPPPFTARAMAQGVLAVYRSLL